MTVGKKIQFYRKKIGLSQEELGQKLLVSRQTVSLWEMDKTMPTVDNLIRLKEIFEVSIDDILTESEMQENTTEEPKEKYQLNYSASELKEIFKISSAPIWKNMIILAAFCVLFVLSAATDAPDLVIGSMFGIFLLAGSYIKGYITYKKEWRSNESRIIESHYSYEIFDTYLIVNISKNHEITKMFKIDFSDIEKLRNIGKYFILQAAGQSFIVKKEILPENSFFYLYHQINPSKAKEDPLCNKWKVISITLFVCSIVSIFVAVMATAALSNINKTFIENTWVLFLFTPIPIASVVIGFILKKKGYKYKKNIVVGIIMTALLCIYGSFTFVFSNTYSHTDKPILQAEQSIGIDIPIHSRINTEDWTSDTQSVSRGYIYSISDIYFEDNAVKEFEEQLKNDSKWVSALPNDMIGITSAFFDLKLYDYAIICNINTKDINKLPTESGTYQFINVLYNSNANRMRLVYYEIEYAK